MARRKRLRSACGGVPRTTPASSASGPCSIHTTSAPTCRVSSVSRCALLNESRTKSRIAVSMPLTRSVSCTTTSVAATCCSNRPLRRSIKNTCSTRYSKVCSNTISANGRPLRLASSRHLSPCTLKLCASIWSSDWVMACSAAAIDLRMAGPMMGKKASASTCGSRRTELAMAASTLGVSAAVSAEPSALCSAMACASTRLTSSVRSSGSSMRRRRCASCNCSSLNSRPRNSAIASPGCTPPHACSAAAGRPRSAAAGSTRLTRRAASVRRSAASPSR